MSATAVPAPARPAARPNRLAGAVRARLRARSREALVFTVATAFALLHALHDAFFLPGPGPDASTHALAAGIAVVSSVVAVAAFPSLRPGVRSAIAFLFGLLALTNAGRHVAHVAEYPATFNDVTGLLAGAAGVAFVGLAAWMPFAHRGEGAATPVRRWVVRALVVAGFVVAVPLVLGPLGVAMVDIHSLREPVGSPPNASYETVKLTTSDDVHLEGWYRPSRNGAAVLLVSGGGSNRMGPLRHARMLERQGYGVMVYDPRGSGNSDGAVNSYGWGWDKDVDAALDYLAQRADVEPGRIAALGLSTGADMAIDAAGRRDDLKAVVADGAAAIGYEDIEEYSDDALTRAPMWVLFKTLEVIDGRAGPKVSLADRIERTRTPHLIISANDAEKEWGELYDERGGERSELWHLPKAGHTQALKQYPQEYEQRVLAFLDRNLTKD